MSQQLLFEQNDVRVTPYIAQFGPTSYQIASISSVRAREAKKLSRMAIFAFLLGIGLFIVAIFRSGRTGRRELSCCSNGHRDHVFLIADSDRFAKARF